MIMIKWVIKDKRSILLAGIRQKKNGQTIIDN